MSDRRSPEAPVVSVGLDVAWAITGDDDGTGSDGGTEVSVDVGGKDVAVGLQAEQTRLRGNRALKIQKLRLMMSSFSARLPDDLAHRQQRDKQDSSAFKHRFQPGAYHQQRGCCPVE